MKWRNEIVTGFSNNSLCTNSQHGSKQFVKCLVIIFNLWTLPNNALVSAKPSATYSQVQYIPRNMHTVFALLCFVVVLHWLIFPYPSGLLHCHCGNLTIAPVPAKQPWWILINTSCEFIMNDCITTTKQSTTKPCAYVLGYTVLAIYCPSVGTHWTHLCGARWLDKLHYFPLWSVSSLVRQFLLWQNE